MYRRTTLNGIVEAGDEGEVEAMSAGLVGDGGDQGPGAVGIVVERSTSETRTSVGSFNVVVNTCIPDSVHVFETTPPLKWDGNIPKL